MTESYKRFVYKAGQVIGETGKDSEASLGGGGNWYAKHFSSGIDHLGFATRKEAILEVEFAHEIYSPHTKDD
tara:strand:+ start:884 stop:1099 length:216 start_codon:yes stop_codon:yes gene_type:complete